MLGPFEIGEPIGRGGMGVVWSGRHVEQDMPVAIKVMTAKTGQKAEHVAAFRQEVRAVAGLHHPGIIMVLDFGLVPASTEQTSEGRIKAGWPYLVMELSSQGALDQIDAPLSWSQVRAILGSLLDALGHAHARGVIHRDIKPANVLLGSDVAGRAGLKLTDFGIAHAMRGPVRSGTTEQTMGTPHFMAPEQFEGRWRDHGPWTDLYALGCMAWEMATGQPLFRGETFWEIAFKHMREPPPDLNAQIPVPEGFADWLGMLLAKAPEDRFQHAADAAWALNQLDGEPNAALDLAAQTASGRWVLDVGSIQTASIGDDTIAEAPRQGPGATVLDDATVDISPGALPSLPIPILNRDTSRWALPPLPQTWRRDEAPGPSMKLVGAGLGLYGLRAIPLVDRVPERDKIWAALQTVRQTRRAKMIVLRGASGHGITRLMEWICARALELGGAEIFEASCGEGLSPEEALSTMVGDRLRCLGLAPEELSERLQRIMARRGIDDDYEWRALSALIARDADSAQVRFDAPRARYVLVARLLERAARTRPAIVAVDDAHWGADALAFAEFILNRQSKVARPILLLMTTQEEGLAERLEETAQINALAARDDVEVVTVGPLMVKDRAALVEELLGLSGELAHQIEARSGGNPAFAVQLVGDWVQRGVLDVAPTGFVLKPGERAELPDSLHQMWAARLARLIRGQNTGMNEALEVAAALGQWVRTSEWAAICDRLAIPLPDIGPTLLHHRLAETFAGGWGFTQNAIRESLERNAREGGRWAEHHAACAAVLGQLSPPPEARLGRHLLEAGEHASAFAHLAQAITSRLDVSNYRGAADLLRLQERALESATDADPRWAWIWTQRARVHVQRGQPAEAAEWAARARDHAQATMDAHTLGDALLCLAHATRGLGQPTQALDLYRQTRNIYQDIDHQRGVSDCLRAMGQLRGSPEPRETRIGHFEHALAICRQTRDDLGAADCLRGLSQLVHATGDLDRAASLGDMAQEMFEAIGNPLGVAHCLNAGAEIARYRGDLDRAEDGYRRALALYEAVGSGSTTLPKLNLALVLLARAQYDEARRLFDTVRAILEKAGRKVFLGAVHANLLPTAAAALDWTAWDHHHHTATTLLATTNLCDDDIAWPAQLAGDLARDAGEPDRARQAYALALAQWTALGRDDKADVVRRSLSDLSATGG